MERKRSWRKWARKMSICLIFLYVCGQEIAAAGRRCGRLMKISLQKWLKNRFMMMKIFVWVFEMNHSYRITHFSICHQKVCCTWPPVPDPICLSQTTISPSNPEITESKQPIRTSGIVFCLRSLNANNLCCVYCFFTVSASRWQCYPLTSTILAAIKLVNVLHWVDPIDLRL